MTVEGMRYDVSPFTLPFQNTCFIIYFGEQTARLEYASVRLCKAVQPFTVLL